MRIKLRSFVALKKKPSELAERLKPKNIQNKLISMKTSWQNVAIGLKTYLDLLKYSHILCSGAS